MISILCTVSRNSCSLATWVLCVLCFLTLWYDISFVLCIYCFYLKLILLHFQKTGPYVWIQTADGSIHEVEKEVASFCPLICHEIESGVGYSKDYPIALPPRVKPAMLSLILDYCRFHYVAGRSNKAINVSLAS